MRPTRAVTLRRLHPPRRPVARLTSAAAAAAVVAVVAIAAAALVLGTSVAASAHAGLVSSEPAAESRSAVNPGSVTLRFTEDVPADLARVSLIGPGPARTLPVSAAGTTGVRATLSGRETGEVRLSYRVTSADGHPIAGEVAFVVERPAAGDSGGQEPSRADSPRRARERSRTDSAEPLQDRPGDGLSGSGTWLLPLGAVLVLAAPFAATMLVLRATGRRRR